MANSRKTKKQLEQIMKNRIYGIICLFIIILGAFKLGLVGEFVNNTFLYLFGYLTYLIYLLCFIYFFYLVYKGNIYQIKGPKLVGSILIFLSLILIFALPKDNISGFSVVQGYFNSPTYNQAGLVGSIFYSLISALFARIGTMIFSVVLLLIGLLFVGIRSYFEYIKSHSLVKKHININKPAISFNKDIKNKFKDFFTDEVEEPEVNEEIIEITPKEIVADEIPFDLEPLPVVIHEEKTVDTIEETKVELDNKKINENYQLPPLTLLNPVKVNDTGKNKDHALLAADRLTAVLNEFGVSASISDIFIGPSVTKYELKLETGTRVNKIMSLQDDIKLALATKDIRIEAPIPGKSAIGIEIPNAVTSMVTFRELFNNIPSSKQNNKLLVPLGKDVSGKPIFAELNKMPHLLIAGATGSGKSVCINTIICSILIRAKPDEVKLILVDPKKVELSSYNSIPHLLAPVVTDSKKAAATLREVVSEMERRYEVFANYNVRNIEGYNQFAKEYNSDNENIEIMPYIVVIIDEVADLMMVASKDVEDCIMRIAQMARAAGIHMIIATQRPSTDVITGVIKANVPSRIAFAVSSSIDSRTILDATGAEKLLGKGDMLFSPMGATSFIRVQGAFVSDSEVEKITNFTKEQQDVVYEERYQNATTSKSSLTSSFDEENDKEYEECRAFVIEMQKASTSLLQRKFRIGYNKAARIIDQLESDGVIGPQIGSKPRNVLITNSNNWEEYND